MSEYDVRSALTFIGVNLPAGAIVNKAFIRFKFWNSFGGNNKIDVWISAAPVGNIPERLYEIDEIPRTEAHVHWQDDLGPMSDGELFDSCDISCVLQELADEGGAADITLFVESYVVECFGEEYEFEHNGLIVCHGITDPSNQGYSTELHVWPINVFTEEGSGGVAGSGSADVSVSAEVYISEGGVEADGLSVVSNFYSPEGGVSASGEVYTDIGFVTMGGVVVSPQPDSWSWVNEPPFGTLPRGILAGGHATQVAHKVYEATGGVTVELGSSPGGITGIRYIASGGIEVNNVLTPTVAYHRFNRTVDLRWKLRTYVKKDLDFLWNTGQLVMYWYRVVGEQLPYDPCDPKPCCQKVVMNVHARTVGELCEKLSARKFNWKIQSVEKYGQPAILGNAYNDWEDQEAAYNEYVTANGNCDNPQPIEVCAIPACANFCIDYDMRVVFNFDIARVSVDGFYTYETGNGESSAQAITIGGNANVVLVRNIPEFRFESTGEWEESGLESATEYYSSHLFSRGGASVTGEAEVACTRWNFVGGEWPTVVGPMTAQAARSVDLESQGGLSPWLFPDFALAVDPGDLMTHHGGLDADVDISYGKTSEYLVISGFELGLPADAAILGIRLVLHRWAEHVGVREKSIVLVHGDTIISTDIADPLFRWPLLPTTVPYGTNGTDGEVPVFEPLDGTWDIDELNSHEFGVAVQIADFDNLGGSIGHLDFLSLEVYYEVPDHQRLRIGGSADVSATRYTHYVTGSVDVAGTAGLRVTRRYIPSGQGTGQPTALVFGGTYFTRFNHITADENYVWADKDEVDLDNVGTVAYWPSEAETRPLQDLIPTEVSADSPWTNPRKGMVADGAEFAFTNLLSTNVSEFLIVRNFVIDFPEHTKIHGIRVIVANRFSTEASVKDRHIYLVQGNSIISEDLAKTEDEWDLVPVSVEYGSTGFDNGRQFRDVTLNPWKLEEVSDPTFGVAISVWAPPLGPGAEPPTKLAKIDGIAIEYTIEAYGRIQTYTSHIQLIDSANCYPNPYIGHGGVAGGGFAVVKPYWDTMQGGLLAGGRYATIQNFSYTASGGFGVQGEGSTIQMDRSFVGTGGLDLGGEARCRSSHFSWVSDGVALYILGAADVRAASLGTATINIGANIRLISLQGVYSEDTEEGTIAELEDVVSKCGCLSIPLTIEVTHNLDQDNVLSKFLVRNVINLPRVVSLYYSEVSGTWQANLHYKGLSADANTTERWDFVFDVECTNNMGGLSIGRSVWKLGVSIFRKNLTTLDDFDTRIVAGVMPETICNTNLNELEFGVTIDVGTGLAAVTPASADVYQVTLYDNIGLFKNPYWKDYPDLTLSVSQSGIPAVPARTPLYVTGLEPPETDSIPSS